MREAHLVWILSLGLGAVLSAIFLAPHGLMARSFWGGQGEPSISQVLQHMPKLPAGTP